MSKQTQEVLSSSYRDSFTDGRLKLSWFLMLAANLSLENIQMMVQQKLHTHQYSHWKEVPVLPIQEAKIRFRCNFLYLYKKEEKKEEKIQQTGGEWWRESLLDGGLCEGNRREKSKTKMMQQLTMTFRTRKSINKEAAEGSSWWKKTSLKLKQQRQWPSWGVQTCSESKKRILKTTFVNYWFYNTYETPAESQTLASTCSAPALLWTWIFTDPGNLHAPLR